MPLLERIADLIAPSEPRAPRTTSPPAIRVGSQHRSIEYADKIVASVSRRNAGRTAFRARADRYFSQLNAPKTRLGLRLPVGRGFGSPARVRTRHKYSLDPLPIRCEGASPGCNLRESSSLRGVPFGLEGSVTMAPLEPRRARLILPALNAHVIAGTDVNMWLIGIMRHQPH